MKNTGFYNEGGLDTVPRSTVGTGTIITSGRTVSGAGTAFLSELKVGSWIFDATINNEIRKVLSIGSDTICYIDEAFTVDIAVAQAFNITSSALTFIGIGIPAAATGFIDNSAVTEKTSVNWGSADNQNFVANPFVDPVVVQPTGGNSFIITTLGK